MPLNGALAVLAFRWRQAGEVTPPVESTTASE